MIVETVLEGRALRRVFATGERKVAALDGLDLVVGAGSFLSVMGPSGSGKTTLLNLLGLLDVPDSGSLHLDGVDVSAMDDRERTALRRDRIGFVFQQFNLVPALTAVENVAVPMLIAKSDRADRSRRALEALERVGLADHATRRPDQLSGGERQRVAIARALVHRPSVVLADEPTGNLDAETGAAIVDLLDEVRADVGNAVVMVTHDESMAARSDRVVRLLDGRAVDPAPVP